MKAMTALLAFELLKTASPSATDPDSRDCASVPAAAVMQTHTMAVPKNPANIILRRPIFSTKKAPKTAKTNWKTEYPRFTFALPMDVLTPAVSRTAAMK